MVVSKLYIELNGQRLNLLVDEFKLLVQDSDIMFEYLKNKDFISEIKEIGLIDEKEMECLADFGKAIELKV